MLSLRNRDFFKELLEAQYLAKFINRIKLVTPLPPLPFPGPGPFEGEPQPQPSMSSLSIDARDVLLGDLLINALGDPSPQLNRPLYINKIRESGIHMEVVKDLLSQFEDGAKALREELELLEKMEKCHSRTNKVN